MHVAGALFVQHALPPLVVPAQLVTVQVAASTLPAIMAHVAVKKRRQDGTIKSNERVNEERRKFKVD